MPDSPNEFASLQKLWDTLCSVRAARGIDEAKIWREWTRQKRESLKEFAAVGSFDELCRSGCHAFPLAITLAIFQPLQSVESKWQLVTDPPRRREQQKRILEKSAAAIGGITGNTLRYAQLHLVLRFPDSRRQKAEGLAVCVKAGQRPPHSGRRALTQSAPRLRSRHPGNGRD